MAVVSNGTTIIDNGAFDAAITVGSLVLLSTQTITTNTALVEFTSGIDSTYGSYIFTFIDLQPSSDVVDFQFNYSTDGGSNYNVTKTSTAFKTWHWEDDSETNVVYDASRDLAQSTGYQIIGQALGTGADEGTVGTLQIFNPSSTTYVKHWISNFSMGHSNNGAYNFYSAGYGNTTSAVNAISFKMESGNISNGIFKMYGMK